MGRIRDRVEAAKEEPQEFAPLVEEMDRFTRNVLIVSLLALLFWPLLGYMGSFYGDMGGTDKKVEEAAAATGEVKASVPVSLSPLGENIVFTLGGVLGGLVVGYYYPDLFESPEGRGVNV